MTDDTAEQTIDLSGAQLRLDGEDYYVEDGELTVDYSHLCGPRGDPNSITERVITIDVQTFQPSGGGDGDGTVFDDRAVYIVREYRDRGDGAPVMIFEDDSDTLSGTIDYCTMLADGNSQILTGEFHAAKPADKFLSCGDWYLTKRHGVSISRGLSERGSE